MNLLYLAHRIPYPPNKGEKIRAYHELRYLCRRHEVSLVCLVDRSEEWTYVDELRKLCRTVDAVPLRTPWASVKALVQLPRRRPLTLGYFGSSALEELVHLRLFTERYDAILVFSSSMGAYVEDVTGTPVVVDFVDVDSHKWHQFARHQPRLRRWIYRLESQRLRAYEARLGRLAKACVFATDSDAALYRALAPEANIQVVPNGVDTDYFRPDLGNGYRHAAKPAVVFTGAMDYFPNADAACYFVREVWPLVRRHVPNARFFIVGRNPTDAVRRLAEVPGVVVTGTVEDVRPYLAQATVSVAPLRIAQGVQNKILEAMAMGVPVVASPEAFDGIRATPGQDLYVESDARRMACRVVKVIRNPHVAQRLRLQGLRVIRKHYDWTRNLSRLEEILLNAVEERPRVALPALV